MNAAQFFDHWNLVWRDLQRAVSLLEDEHLDFRPSETYPRTVAGVLSHIMNLEEGWIHYVVRRQRPGWPGESTLESVEGLQRAMNTVHQETMDYLATVPIEEFDRIIQVPEDGTPKLGWILWYVFEQQIHHRGELFLCLSLLGLERPKTDRPE